MFFGEGREKKKGEGRREKERGEKGDRRERWETEEGDGRHKSCNSGGHTQHICYLIELQGIESQSLLEVYWNKLEEEVDSGK